jgi:phosphoribosylamine--glycine ligase
MAPDAPAPRSPDRVTLVAPTRILIVGAGGREHALAWKLAAEPGVNEIVVAPGSAGIATEPRVRCLPGVDPLDPKAVVAAARSMAVELVVVGPEAPLAVGLVDGLAEAGVTVFGPTRAAAKLETSKAYCHEVAAATGVPMARARSFDGDEVEGAAAFIRELESASRGVVLKADGLAAGKGVIVTDSVEQALELAPSFLVGRPSGEPALVIEERLEGREASVIAICDGTRAIALPAARDYKRLCDDDQGPNTGGMGAYSPLPDLGDADVEEVLQTVHGPMLAEMARRGRPFRGFLYAGLMLTADGPVLLECNVRLGDPEAQVVLPRISVPLGTLLLAAAKGRIPASYPALVPTTAGAVVGIVLAAKGYPGQPKRGDPIVGLDDATAAGALVFHAGTVGRPQGGFGTSGGRVLTVVGRGRTLDDARRRAEHAADAISWHGMQRRHDIASGAAQASQPVALAGVAR